MNYSEFHAGDKDARFKLSTRSTVSLEKQLGCNPVAIFGSGDTIPTITTMVRILHASLQSYEHGITLDDAYDIFDKWLEDGHVMTHFIAVIIDIYKASGILKDTEEASKN